MVIIALSCGGDLRRKFPINLIALAIFVSTQSLILCVSFEICSINFKLLVPMARILESRITLIHPHSMNKSDFTDLIFCAMFCKLVTS